MFTNGFKDGNAALAEERGYSIKLNKFSITKENVIDALKAVVGDDDGERYALLNRHTMFLAPML